MNGSEIRRKRQEAGLSGHVVCRKAEIARSRLTEIERGYVQASDAELDRVERALIELAEARRKVMNFAAECGWPVSAI